VALAFLTLNGDEAGHHVRTTAVCRALASVGERPVIFSQGLCALDDDVSFPGKHVPSLREAGERVRRQVAWDIQSVIGISLPAVLVEDTHPNPIRLPSSVRRILLVPPATFDALQELDQRYREVYSAFVLCDAPGSSTWPYSESETATILASDRWHVIESRSGAPDASRLQQVIVGARPRQPAGETSAGAATTPDSRRVRRGWTFFRRTDTPLVIRIDDVVALDAPLRWLLEMLAARQLQASLDVVPYLATVTEQAFDAIDASRTLFEVAQHGYAHIPYTIDGKRYEFAPAMRSSPKALTDADAIACGKRRIETLFPARFRGGFSAPFDGLPDWLPAHWAQVGGAFVSCLSSRPRQRSLLPVVRAGVDVWQWRKNRGLEPRDVVRRMRTQLADDGHAGLVLHAHCYVRRVERERLCRVLDAVDAEGFRSVPLHQRAAARAW
jgi:hypothetical protein